MRCFRYFLLSAVGLRVWGVHFNSNACINFFFWYSYYCIGRALLQERRLIKFMNKYFTIIVFIIIIIFGTWFFSTRSSETNVTNLGLKLESENKTVKTTENIKKKKKKKKKKKRNKKKNKLKKKKKNKKNRGGPPFLKRRHKGRLVGHG